jgi:hypothetical protein
MPKLEECGSCGEPCGTLYGFGKCADCINSKGYAHVCGCNIPGCKPCERHAERTPEEIEERRKEITELHASLRRSGVYFF